MLEATLYTRPRCSLCEKMKAELIKRGYRLREVNVDSDPKLKQTYGADIPVAVLPDGAVLAKHRLDP
jgi:glutaredoxin